MMKIPSKLAVYAYHEIGPPISYVLNLLKRLNGSVVQNVLLFFFTLLLNEMVDRLGQFKHES